MISSQLYWVRTSEPYRLALSARPRGGEWLEQEMQAWQAAGLTSVLSLLEPSETYQLELSREQALCEASGLEFLPFPIPDRGVPAQLENVASISKKLASELKAGRAVLIHCRAGIGRTGLMAACVLHHLEIDPGLAFALLSQARGISLPDTQEQEQWVKKYVKWMACQSSLVGL